MKWYDKLYVVVIAALAIACEVVPEECVVVPLLGALYIMAGYLFITNVKKGELV